MVNTYSDDMIARWNAEIDTYLVFAGLFSAILTAFNVQSYQTLQPATPDPTTAILQRISLQLGSLSNSSQPASSPSDVDLAATPAPVARSAIWLNVFWFASLIFSISSAFLGILVKQWLNEYKSELRGSSREVARLRQYRLNNLIKWRVDLFVTAIPLLLQIALALFLVGLLVLLWSLHHGVAAVVSVLIGLFTLFVTTTTVLPLVNTGCAYSSPQTLMLDVALRRSSRVLNYLQRTLIRPLVPYVAAARDRLKALTRASLSLVAGSSRMAGPTSEPRLPFTRRQPQHVQAKAEDISDWHAQERALMAVPELRDKLDIDVLSMAYTATLDSHAIAAAAKCLTNFTRSDLVIHWYQRVLSCHMEHFGLRAIKPFGPFGAGIEVVLWGKVLLCMLDSLRPTPFIISNWQRVAGELSSYLKYCDWLSWRPVQLNWVLSTFFSLSRVRPARDAQWPPSAYKEKSLRKLGDRGYDVLRLVRTQASWDCARLVYHSTLRNGD
ncbi:hypothetical protein BD414DRAFT_317958 [Trametes punicea]|nr:hypothetical protein BD414DRAFT_317958 [Trametes punicea]